MPNIKTRAMFSATEELSSAGKRVSVGLIGRGASLSPGGLPARQPAASGTGNLCQNYDVSFGDRSAKVSIVAMSIEVPNIVFVQTQRGSFGTGRSRCLMATESIRQAQQAPGDRDGRLTRKLAGFGWVMVSRTRGGRRHRVPLFEVGLGAVPGYPRYRAASSTPCTSPDWCSCSDGEDAANQLAGRCAGNLRVGSRTGRLRHAAVRRRSRLWPRPAASRKRDRRRTAACRRRAPA